MGDAREALASGGLADVADRAWAQLTTPPGIPTVAVIGEIKRGKSSLINVLLGHPDASPVDVDVATSAFIRFVPVEPPAAEGDTALLFAGGRRKAIDFADLPEWVTIGGRHVVDTSVDELPIGAEVSLAGQFLPGVAMVDTPGVGGLNPMHLRLATMASTSASILLMTCDATAPITAPELSFLKSISGDVDSVIIAVTKIDKNFRHWRSILDENRRLLNQYAPRFADVPIVGVSSLRARSALQMEPGERRDSVLRASGLLQLVDYLQEICSAGARLSVANGLRIARTGLQRLDNQLEMQQSAIKGKEDAVVELTAEESRLKELKAREGAWREELNRELSALQRDTLKFADHQLDELKANWKRRLDATKLDLLRRSPQRWVAEMTADLEALVARVSDEYRTGLAKLLQERSIEAEVAVGTFDTRTRGEDPRKRIHGVFDPGLVMFATVGTASIGHQLLPWIGVAAGATLFGPLTLALGGSWLAVNLGFRAIRAGRQNLQQWINTTAGAVTKDLNREVQERQEAVRPIITNDYKRQLSEAISEVQRLITAAQNAAAASGAQRQEALNGLDAKRTALAATAAAIDAQLASSATAVVSDDPADQVGSPADPLNASTPS